MQDKSKNITLLPGIGEKTASALREEGILTIRDFLYHFPTRYETLAPITASPRVEEGETIAVYGFFPTLPAVYRHKGRTQTRGVFRYEGGSVEAIWFSMPYIRNTIRPGAFCVLRGRVSVKGRRQFIVHPQIFPDLSYRDLVGKTLPLYPKLPGISLERHKKLIQEALNLYEENDILPLSVRDELHLIGEKEALKRLHFPVEEKDFLTARRRLVFQEFWVFLRDLYDLRLKKERDLTPYPVPGNRFLKEWIERLPYRLTASQEEAIQEIAEDMKGPHPMRRMLQGDVGSGKTIVAFLAMLLVADAGFQACLMAPTEVLALQHEANLKNLLQMLGREDLKVTSLRGSLSQKEKKERMQLIASHKADFVIGTHALFQSGIVFDRLALVITDEQHRFGVKQRNLLQEKGDKPHVLSMSATPIPRSLAILLFGDRELSTLKEKPLMRKDVLSCALPMREEKRALNFLHKIHAEGGRAYIVVPMIEEGEIEAESIESMEEKLIPLLPAGMKLGILHGKMKEKEKQAVLDAFRNGELSCLLSTTVIEVGVDVKEARCMIIYNSDRFGLAQLHQLRGRVGRGSEESYCIFLYDDRNPAAKERLEFLSHHKNGFEVAEEDLRLRGPGEFFGFEQSGPLAFRLGDIREDRDLLEAAIRLYKETYYAKSNRGDEASPSPENPGR